MSVEKKQELGKGPAEREKIKWNKEAPRLYESPKERPQRKKKNRKVAPGWAQPRPKSPWPDETTIEKQRKEKKKKNKS